MTNKIEIEWKEYDASKHPKASRGEVILWHYPPKQNGPHEAHMLTAYTTLSAAPNRCIEGTKYARIKLP